MLNVGIDLGTTHSVLALRGDVKLLESGGRDTLLPSVVAFPPSGGALVGFEAADRRAIDPQHTLFSFKRLMGQQWHGSARPRFQEHYPHTLEADGEGGVVFDTRAGKVSAEGLSAMLLSHLGMRAGVAPAQHSAVVTVPSSFDVRARQATAQAAEHAGFAQVRLIEEPVAIAMAYMQRANLRHAVVYDMGGGTFDCAVVDCERYPFTVLGHAGDGYLGGDDLDYALASDVAAEVLQSRGWDLKSERVTFHALVVACEWAKIQLSTQEQVDIELAEVDPAAPGDIGSFTVTRARLASHSRPLIMRTFQLADEVLGQVSLKASDMQAVFLAGGSSGLPGLPEAVGDYFGRRPRMDLDPSHVVAIGASVVAARPNLWPLLAD